jgi:hypothetical protein
VVRIGTRVQGPGTVAEHAEAERSGFTADTTGRFALRGCKAGMGRPLSGLSGPSGFRSGRNLMVHVCELGTAHALTALG